MQRHQRGTRADCLRRNTRDLFSGRALRGVDIVPERGDGTIGPIEAKASAAVKAGNLSGPWVWAEAGAYSLAFGVVLHGSPAPVPFGGRLMAVRISCP